MHMNTVAVLMLSALAYGLDQQPPAAWVGKDGEPAVQGPWQFCQVWPDKTENHANYHPLTWRGNAWGASEHNMGDAPGARLTDSTIILIVRGNWGGIQEPGQRISAVVFTAPEAGVWRVQAKVQLKRGSGGGPNHVRLIALPAADVPYTPLPRYGDKTPWYAKPHPRTVASLRFRRPDPEPLTLDRSVFLAAGERIVLVPGLGDNNSATVTIAGLRLSGTPAVAPPADFNDGIMPAPPLPRAEDEIPPKTEIAGEQIAFPADSNVRDVTKAPYNAVGDGKTDCTRAIQDAIDDGGVIYLPNGVYLISDQLRYTGGARVPSRITLHGQSIAGTILKLRNRTPDFGDAKQAFAMLWVSKFPPQAFRNHVRNLTFHTGSGNPGAIGCQFYANNQGSIEDVRFVSGDGSGPIGLDLGFDDDQGPMLARGIEVIGFDYGIRTARQTTVTTCADISVRGQRVAGWLNDLHAIAVRNFTSVNSVPAMISPDPGGHVALIGARLEGGGEAAKGPAIINAGGMLLRDVRTIGYACAVEHAGTRTAGQDLTEWTSSPVLTLWEDTPKRSLRLPIVDPPRIPWGDPATWHSAVSGEAETVDTGTQYKGKPVTWLNWRKPFQDALNSGAATVYFPRGNYSVDGEVRVPKSVRRLIGIESSFDRDRGRCTLVIEDGPEPLVIERFDWNYSKVTVVHATKRPLYLKNIVGSHYQPKVGAGDVWLDDICQGGLSFLTGQRVWARQLNPEYGDKPHITNQGADLWMLGLKTEGYSTIVATGPGGRTELLGGCVYANQGREAQPAFITAAGGAFSGSWAEWILRSSAFEEVVVESREGKGFRVLSNRDVPKRGDAAAKQLGGYGTSSMVPLYAGYTADRAGEGSK